MITWDGRASCVEARRAQKSVDQHRTANDSDVPRWGVAGQLVNVALSAESAKRSSVLFRNRFCGERQSPIGTGKHGDIRFITCQLIGVFGKIVIVYARQ
jgi:hypothetical protein